MPRLNCLVVCLAALLASTVFASGPRLLVRVEPAAGGKVAGPGPLGLPLTCKDGAKTSSDARATFQFAEGDARVELGKHTFLDRLTRDFSISLWVKPTELHKGDVSFILTKRPAWWTSKPLSIGIQRNGTVELGFYDGHKWRTIRSGGKRLQPGEWTHLECTVTVGGETVLYMNGERAGAANTPFPLAGNGESWALGFEEGGNFPGGNYKPYRGLTGRLAFFSGILSPEQIRAEMKGEFDVPVATPADIPPRGMVESQIPEAARTTPVPNAPLECSILFDREPHATGMWFDGSSVEPREAAPGGTGKMACWAAKGGSAPGVPWARSLRLVVTDPRFQQGRMPAVDVELVVHAPAWAGLDVWADCATGSRKVYSGWGNQKGWQTIRFTIDDAFFGRRDHGRTNMDMPSDGYDLRINHCNEDLLVREVRIKGYDLDKDVDFRRLVRMRGIDPSIFLFRPNTAAAFRFRFANLSRVALGTTWSFGIESHAGEKLWQAEGETQLAAADETALEIPFRTDGYLYGTYVARLVVRDRAGKQGDSPVYEKECYFGVVSPTELGKAGPGEFLYGLDVGLENVWRGGRAMAWCRELGVDIVRGGFNPLGSDEDIEAALGTYEAAGLSTMPMAQPEYAAKPEERRRRVAKQVARLRDVLRTFGSRLHYWELGNEPDLPFFYPGEIAEYTEGFEQFYEAIKAGDPESCIMNGGLCFFGQKLDKLRESSMVERALAAVELYVSTGEQRFHDAFKSDNVLARGLAPDRGSHALFTYARLPDDRADMALRDKARAAIVQLADTALGFQTGNAFGIATVVPGFPMMGYLGYYSTPGMVLGNPLPEAYILTGDEKYLLGTVAAANFSAGANPLNMTFTVGVGQQYPLKPLHIDSRITGQPAPKGITIYGPMDPDGGFGFNNWVHQWYLQEMTPNSRTWPAAEWHADLPNWPAVSEYTIHQTMGHTAYYWGFLAARETMGGER